MSPGALHFAKNLQKDFSYYFVNFCLEKKLGGLKGGAFIKGGGGIKTGVYGTYIRNACLQMQLCFNLIWRCLWDSKNKQLHFKTDRFFKLQINSHSLPKIEVKYTYLDCNFNLYGILNMQTEQIYI